MLGSRARSGTASAVVALGVVPLVSLLLAASLCAAQDVYLALNGFPSKVTTLGGNAKKAVLFGSTMVVLRGTCWDVLPGAGWRRWLAALRRGATD